MKCFYHTNIDAVAICKNCGRALCPESLVEVGNGIACKNRCEADVETINKVFQQSKRTFDNYRTTYSVSAVWLSLIGIGFVISAFILTPRLMGFLITMGLLMLSGGVFYYFIGKRYNSK